MDNPPRLSRLGRPSKDIVDDGTARAGLALAVRFWREQCPPCGTPSQEMIKKATPFSLNKVKSQLHGEEFMARAVIMYIAGSKASAEQLEEWEELYEKYLEAHQREQEGEVGVEKPPRPSWQSDVVPVLQYRDEENPSEEESGEHESAEDLPGTGAVSGRESDERESAANVSNAEEVSDVEPAASPVSEEESGGLTPDQHESDEAASSGLNEIDPIKDTVIVGNVPNEQRPQPLRFRSVVASAILVILIAVAFILFPRTTSPVAPITAQPSQMVRTITVQNRVALGSSTLTEDKTPEYLSTAPRPYCADEVNHCKVSGSDMQSGAAVQATCVVTTDVLMFNYDTKDASAVNNPDAARSRLWYYGMRNGQFGYIAEVYVVARDRGGLGLPTCPS